MYKQFIRPSELLKQYIKCFVVFEASSLSEYKAKQRIYPRGCIDLVFHYGQPFLFRKRNESFALEPRSVVCGQQMNYYDLSPSGKTGMVYVMFRPFGAGMFFKVPMNEIANQNVAFECLANKEAFEIEDKILNATCIRERVTIIEDFLIEKLIQNNNDARQIVCVLNKIFQRKGQISIKQLAETACLSIKQFERKFSGLIGLNPKQFLRIVRFQNVLQMKKNRHNDNLTSLALESGYYDQSHFINDFRLITGLTPKEFFKVYQFKSGDFSNKNQNV